MNRASPGSSPSQQAARREQSVVPADALAELPDDYRDVLVLRHLEGLTFPQVAVRMGRTWMKSKRGAPCLHRCPKQVCPRPWNRRPACYAARSASRC